ncbi:AAA family ATPase [Azonexus sp.]|jgi:type II secretory pathway predicted ATPase ExeA|uniref:ExeA family protein n=1 Tax=Azonexus sp. TaxID=1872668 RepID=UPI00281BB699|nr:AAA family ATPase [Azonexus sp.]MDR1995131.1 AAA family ATPase [Azonexus sp.]
MASPLNRLIARLGLKQAHLARDLGISTGTFADLVNHGEWPKRNAVTLRLDLEDALRRAGASSAQITRALAATEKQNARCANAGRPTAVPGTGAAFSQSGKKETDMLLQKQTLQALTRKHFNLTADPFTNDIGQASDVYISQDIRFVRETLWQHAKHGGLLALVGESGSGKSTVVADFKDRLAREGRDVLVIEPSVLYMEENDSKGKTLKSAAIVQAIIATVAPSVTPKRDADARARQVQQLLTAGHRAGQRHVLLIEEAHCLPTPTLKHLKRFAEIRDGLSPLLSIVLVGQPELKSRLAVNNAEVREVAQRCDIVELPPLDGSLADYLKFKLARIGADIGQVISPEGIEALRERLTFARKAGNAKSANLATQWVSLAYPLAVANALTAAMNLAASLGAPVVDAAIVKEA